MQTRSALAAALFVCSGLALSAGQARQEPTPAFRSGVELVTVDVGVVDRQGQPLRDLGPADFVVTVAGQPRRVVTAELVDVGAAPADGQPRADVVPVSTNEGGGVGRLFVFVVDQSTLDPGSVRDVSRAAAGFLSRLTFADRSAMMVLPVGPHVDFTWAHDRVRDALQRVSGTPRLSSMWESGSLAEARDIANRNQFALRSVGERECGFSGGSIFASGAGQAAPGPAPSTPAPAPPSGNGTPPGDGTGGTGSAPAGAPTAGAGNRGSTVTGGLGGFGRDSCLRDLQMQAETAWRTTQMTSLSSLTALRQLLATLGRVRGDKTVILISGGWPLDDREETSLLAAVAADAAAARATFYTLFVPASTFSADRRMVPVNPTSDQFLHSGPLDTLAGMTGGGSYRAEVNADAAFARLGRELRAYYRVGVEKDPADLDGKSRSMKVQVTRSGATARARAFFDVRTYEDRDWAARLSSALEAPVPATGIGLRATSYLAADLDDRTRLKLVLTGEASRIQPGEATVQILVRDLEGKKVLSAEPPAGEARGDALAFSTSFPVYPGSYIVRIAVIDSTGRVGSVEHRVDAHQVPLGALSATGPVLIRVPSRPEADALLLLNSVQQDERLALEVDLRGDSAGLAAAAVVFEIAATAGGPALIHANAALSKDPGETAVMAQAVAEMRVLPAGTYVVRAVVKSGDETLGEVRRSFAVTGSVPPAVVASGTPAVVEHLTPAAASVRAVGAVRPFALDQVLAPAILGTFLDSVAARPDASSPAVRGLLERARTGAFVELTPSETVTAGAPVAAFLQGLTLLAQKKFDPAADAFRRTIRVAADFYPAMVYLGACYAAGGHDKEAAGAWRTALIKEGDAVALHRLLADALLRQGQRDLALDTVTSARARWPEDEALERQFAVAALLAGQYAEGLAAVDGLIAKHAEDEPSLALALLTLYEAFERGRPVTGVEQDRARMIRLAEAYRGHDGPSMALVDAWLAATAARK